ncbi:SRPBCC domain-containing protein [Amycolatopsis sp. NPDC051903]|uniref:SRPBCC domain-containing protein n=1 Tax=Amycolatopsis sp. NPDC051903 TaxID=3363936 RepID=UPI0037955694
MTAVKHSTFTLERRYPVPPARVFAAWADPAAKAGWFGADEHSLDFRVGGRETNHGGDLTFAAEYHDIVEDERIVYGGTLSGPAGLATVSVTTVELVPDGAGTRLVLTEQGTFLDGHEEPEWRERGTGDWLDKLGSHLGG